MADVVLATANARYQHASLALRCLQANLGAHKDACVLVEGTIHDRAIDLTERILAHAPRVVGLSVYVWNTTLLSETAALLKGAAPDVVLVVGGPEVSHEHALQPICAIADVVVTGEGEEAFRSIVARVLAGESAGPHVVKPGLPRLETMALPYDLYTDDDIKNRVIYVESSRGCPFTCSFCLSSIDERVRRFPLEPFLAALTTLHARGARTFKFIDRTFNVHMPSATAILDLFLSWQGEGSSSTETFAHFEVVPDRLPDVLKERLARFRKGTVQLEVGVQTLDDETSRVIARAHDRAKIFENIRFLVEETGAHVHADLIAGLPGEGLASFARGFDLLYRAGPHEIQLGILKRLRGTPLVNDTDAYGLVFNPHPPYEIVRTHALSFDELCRVRRFARAYDLTVNGGRFPTTAPLLLMGAGQTREANSSENNSSDDVTTSPFAHFMAFSEWLHLRAGALHGIALARLAEYVFTFLTDVRGHQARDIAARLLDDYTRTGERRAPPFLLSHQDVPLDVRRAFDALGSRRVREGSTSDARTARQARHHT